LQTGLDVFLKNPLPELAGKRVGVLTNTGAVDERMQPSGEAILALEHMKVDRFFAGEHGLYGEEPAGTSIRDSIDPRTGRPVVSLFRSGRALGKEQLDGLDDVLTDVMDIGCRYYTVLGTTLDLLKACHSASVPMYLLDRPNPLGALVEGQPGVDSRLRSLVGSAHVPIRHGLTIGELLILAAREHGIEDTLHVVRMTAWSRTQLWPDLHRPWVPPSPNTDGWDMVRLYCGTCLVEGTNMSEGRGTAFPFQVIGAPWLDMWKLAGEANSVAPDGVYYRPTAFVPTYSKHSGKVCRGVMVHLDPRKDPPVVEAGLNLLAAAFRHPATEFRPPRTDREPRETAHYGFDLLAGDDKLRQDLAAARPVPEILEEWRIARSDWPDRMREVSLYPV
jgi:uncharacterized protein YbbC (DUF1343 family)